MLPETITNNIRINTSKNALSFDVVKTRRGEIVDFSHKDYPLKQISEEELLKVRCSYTPFFVYKENNSLYASKIPKSLRFLNIGDSCGHICQRCNRVLHYNNSEQGCPKIQDRFLTESQHSSGIIEKILDAKRIEKYPFIVNGYESINTRAESFVVTKCNRFEPISDVRYKQQK